MKKILLFTISFLFIFTSTVKAQNKDQHIQSTALKVTPVILPLQLSPNQTISKDIEIENMSSFPQPLRAVFSDFQSTGEDGGYEFQQTAKNPLLSWTKIEPQEIIIAPHAKEKVTVTIKTPHKIPVGGYFGMVFFEPVPQPSAQQNATQVVARIGVLMLGSVGIQDTHALDILTFDLPVITDTTDAIPVLLRVKNTGLEYITAKPIITLRSFDGHEQKTIWEDKVVFPGNIRRWEKHEKVAGWNIYTEKTTVSMGNGKTVSTQRLLIVFPYKIFIAVMLSLILSMLIYLKREKVIKALRVIFFG